MSIPIDIFDTRTMLQALETMFIPRTFLLDTFFKTTEQSQTKYVDIDIIKGKRRLAPFVTPMAEGKVVERTGFSTKSFSPPYIKQKMATKAWEMLMRSPGDTIYQGNSSPAARAAVQVGKDLLELTNMIIRREEWMASQALTTGTITVLGEGVNDSIDFSMASDHKVTLSGGTLWSASTGVPINNLRAWKKIVARDSGLVPDVAIFGKTALDAFLANTQVTGSGGLNNWRINIGQIDPRLLPDGVTYYGQIEFLDIYAYDEYYVADADLSTGTLTPMVPDAMVILGSTKARTARHYGAIQDLKAAAAVPYFPKSWEEDDPSLRWLMVQSAPLVVPHQIDAFLYATVL